MKEALDNNESLHQASQMATHKYEECKDQLDQLEGFQNQELGKVKHMLLNAENALAKEKERQSVQQDQKSVQTEQQNTIPNETIPSDHSLDQIIRERDHLQEKQALLETEMTKISTERDALRASLLEIEIAKHDGDNAQSEEIRSKDLKICALEATIETLHVTLTVRDNDIKAKKDELNKLKATCADNTESLRARDVKIEGLESEIERINAVLQKRLMEIRDCQRYNDDLSVDLEQRQATIQDLQQQLKEALQLNADLENEAKELTNQLNVLDTTCKESEKSMDILDKKVLSLREQNAILDQKVLNDKEENQLLSTKLTNALKEKADLEKSIPALVETSELVRNLKVKVVDLEENLEERNQAVRHLQLRANEMKKMLKSRFNGISSEPALSPSPSPTPPVPSNNAAQVSSDSYHHPVSDVTLRYLKNVIFKFLTSPETEAKQMTRAVATLLDFSLEEEQTLSEYLEWKVSWFGFAAAKPKLIATDTPVSSQRT